MIIKTSVKKKIVRTAAASISSAAVFAAAAGAVMLFPETFGYADNTAGNALFIGVENANDAPPVLYETTVPAVTQEVTVPETQIPAVGSEETADVPEDHPETYIPQLNGKVLTVNRSDEREDLTLFTEHTGKIDEQTFGKYNGGQYIDLAGGGQLRNCTDIDREKVQYASGIPCNISVDLYTDEPQVLIVHTHTTESYEPCEKDWYDGSYASRSFDPDNGVVSVGDAIAGQLAKAGISVVHDCTVHDATYTGAYVRSLSTVTDILAKYPSVKVVLDIHRDAIEYEDGTRVSAVTEINGKKAAQTMIICAADDGTYGVPDFYENLHFACELQSAMESEFPTLTRPILFQYCQYNQQVSPGALLIEVGSHGNSAEQATYSGELIGKALAKLLTEKAQPVEAVPVLASVPIYFIDRLR